jgi:hypothetical protein
LLLDEKPAAHQPKIDQSRRPQLTAIQSNRVGTETAQQRVVIEIRADPTALTRGRSCLEPDLAGFLILVEANQAVVRRPVLCLLFDGGSLLCREADRDRQHQAGNDKKGKVS